MAECAGCSRRALIRGLAVAAAGAVIAACRADTGLADGGPGVDAPPPVATMCGANLCVDLTNPGAAALAKVGGTILVAVPGDLVIIVRETATTWIVLSAICTHAGCSVNFSAAAADLACPCHGSRFALSGAVTRGPATRALTAYASQLDASAQILTILL